MRCALEQRRELLARRRRLEDASVEQLVEQHRLLGDLAREPRAVRDELEQPLERCRILVEQREVGAAPADGTIHGQDALEALERRRVFRKGVDRPHHDGRQALPADLVHALVETAVTQVFQEVERALVTLERSACEHRGRVARRPSGQERIELSTA